MRNRGEDLTRTATFGDKAKGKIITAPLGLAFERNKHVLDAKD